jgi:hypothetical protein
VRKGEVNRKQQRMNGNTDIVCPMKKNLLCTLT